MLTIRIKNHPTFGNLQASFELSIKNKWTYYCYARELERIVKFFGKDRYPGDIFKQDILNLKAYLIEHYDYSEKHVKQAIAILSSYYNWMVDMGLVDINPVRKGLRMPTHDVEVVLEQ